MYIYRVEDENGYGPYCNYDVCCQFNHHTNIKTHPNTWNDKHRRFCDIVENNINNKARHGFLNLGSYHRWFSESDKKILREYGFQLVKYQININYVEVRTRQIRFHIDYATKLETYQI